MARTIYFSDGSHEVLLCGEHDAAGNIAALERILRDRLGSDAAELFLQIMKDRKEEADALSDELNNYMLSCESYRNCLQDVFDGLGAAAEQLVQKCINKQKIDDIFCRLLTTINNEL